jgi:hypothetical protein
VDFHRLFVSGELLEQPEVQLSQLPGRQGVRGGRGLVFAVRASQEHVSPKARLRVGQVPNEIPTLAPSESEGRCSYLNNIVTLLRRSISDYFSRNVHAYFTVVSK